VDGFVDLTVLHGFANASDYFLVGQIVVGVPGVDEAHLVVLLMKSMVQVVQKNALVHALGFE